MKKGCMYNKNLIENARELRKSMTKEEKHLWYDFLKNYPVRFTRQKVINKYIADFYCAKAKLIVELDGAQHYEEKAIEYDNQRTEFLNSYGIEVVRFLNKDVMMKFETICEAIDVLVRERIKE